MHRGQAEKAEAVKAEAVKADLIFLDARVHTMESGRPRARAVAIADGRFLSVGEEEEVLCTAGDSTVVESLGGAAVLPGLVDSHVHADAVGRVLRDADLYDARSVAEIVERLEAHARELGSHEAICGRGDCFHPTSLAEGRVPTRRDLDRVATDRVVAVTDVNKTVVNTFTLVELGITDDAVPPAGGMIGRDPGTRRLDGTFYFAAKAMTPLGAQSASGSDVPLAEAIAGAANAMVAAGITSAVLPRARRETIAAIRGLAGRGELPLRFTVLPPAALLDEEGALGRAGLVCGAGTDTVTVGPLKVFYDGFLMHRTALMREPYAGEAEGCGPVGTTPWPGRRGPVGTTPWPGRRGPVGTTAWPGRRGPRGRSPGELAAIVRRAEAGGFALAVHVTGDRALEEVVEVLADASTERLACPHQVIHAYFPGRRVLDTMAEAGIAAAVQPPFLRAWGETVREFVGPERARGFMPLRAFLEAGVTCGGGSDAPVAGFRPGLGVHAAVTRLTAAGDALGEEHALSTCEALELYTLGSAAVTGEAAEKGSIVPGKLADMIVLERDPFMATPDHLLDLRVARTVVGGKTVFRKRDAGGQGREGARQ